MPSSFSQLIIGMIAAIGIAVVTVSVIGSAVAQSPHLVGQASLTNRYQSPVSEIDFRPDVSSSGKPLWSIKGN